MSGPVHYRLEGRIATLALDDGKVNAMSLAMLQAINDALDRAQAEAGTVLLAGRDGVFSAGFDLPTLRGGGTPALQMLEAGARLCERLMGYPLPVLAAVTGPAMAMGAFLALSTDIRIGIADGKLKMAANEVAIGIPVPRFALAVLGHRLAPAHLDRAAITSQPYDAKAAVAAGWLDEIVPGAQLAQAAHAGAEALAAFDAAAFKATKRRVRAAVLQALGRGIAEDTADWRSRI